MRSRFRAPISSMIMLVTVIMFGASTVGQTGGQEAARRGQTPRGRISTIPAEPELLWPLPASAKAYDTIDGRRMKGYVEELAAIARKSRDAGNQYWGRIVGTPSGAETQQWVTAKFRQAGLDVQVKEYDLRPQPIPKSWDITVTGGGKTIKLTSASPAISFAQYMPSPEGNLELETAWVGLGMASDFIGKDVRGKAVFIYSIPTPSSLIQSEGWMGAAERAQKMGAKAIVVVLAIPGNMAYVSHLQGLSNDYKMPVFTVGLNDGEAVESLNALSASGKALMTRLRWNVPTIPGLKAADVVGVLPGQTDENIVMISHTDGFFEGANDNAAGTASLVGLAEYYAKVPKERRRRTMYFIATPDHHGGDQGGRWIHDNMQDVLAKTAVVLNAEHVAVMEPVWDRPWGSSVRPELIKTNQLGASWWGVYGSDRLTQIIKGSFAMFGVPTQLEQGGSAGELRAVQFDAPSFYLHNKGVYYHASADTVDVVPATGLRTATQAFAKIFDDVNTVSLKELRSTVAAPTATTASGRRGVAGEQ
jgi:hypothetical protein